MYTSRKEAQDANLVTHNLVINPYFDVNPFLGILNEKAPFPDRRPSISYIVNPYEVLEAFRALQKEGVPYKPRDFRIVSKERSFKRLVAPDFIHTAIVKYSEKDTTHQAKIRYASHHSFLDGGLTIFASYKASLTARKESLAKSGLGTIRACPTLNDPDSVYILVKKPVSSFQLALHFSQATFLSTMRFFDGKPIPLNSLMNDCLKVQKDTFNLLFVPVTKPEVHTTFKRLLPKVKQANKNSSLGPG